MESNDIQGIKDALRSFIAEEFLPGEDPGNLADDTPLISGRILDSLATLRLIEFVEKKFKVEIRPEEMTEEYLDSIDSISELVLGRS